MKTFSYKYILFYVFFCCTVSVLQAQVGINTTDPEGALDVVAADQGFVMPRVSAVENVVTPDGNPAVNGTMVYDLSRDQICTRIAGLWVCRDETGKTFTIYDGSYVGFDSYIKASNTGASDFFGISASMSADGNYLAIGALREDSDAIGINGDDSNNLSANSGAVYVFVRSGGVWSQQAYIKASNSDGGDLFGTSVSLSADGTYLAVGANSEDSNATGINGIESDNSSVASGAVYVFVRSGTTWTQQAYIKSSNSDASDGFGEEVAISEDGVYLAVGTTREDSNATGINGNETDNSASSSGAVYVFVRSGITWSQQAYLKASNTEISDNFGYSVTISADGSYIAVGALYESSNATGINGDDTDNSENAAGAVYIFVRSGTTWSQQAYVKASNTESNDAFGSSVSLSGDGSYLAVGSFQEDSSATGINGDQSSNDVASSGAAYVFLRSGTTWSQIAYIKAPNSDVADLFGRSLAFSTDGNRLVIGTSAEDSNAIGIGGDASNNDASSAGAVYSYVVSGTTITFNGYIKASNTNNGDGFGSAISLNSDGTRLLVSATGESSNATGVGGDQSNNSSNASGAVYIIE